MKYVCYSQYHLVNLAITFLFSFIFMKWTFLSILFLSLLVLDQQSASRSRIFWVWARPEYVESECRLRSFWVYRSGMRIFAHFLSSLPCIQRLLSQKLQPIIDDSTFFNVLPCSFISPELVK